MYHSTRTLRRPTAATIIATIALTASFVIAGASTVDAQSNKKGLVGSWLETVTFPPELGWPQVKSLVSYHDDGIMVASDQGGVTIEPPTVYSSGHGVWKHLNDHTFAYSVLYILSDLSGNLTGYLKVRGVFSVSQSGNEYNGTSFAEVLDADNNVLFSVEVTNTAQRIQIELP
jgi:hypothetical protein